MRTFTLLSVAAALILVFLCFQTWAVIPKFGLRISGVAAEGTSFGKPGYFHLLMVVCYLGLLFIRRRWSKFAAAFFCALNIAWAFRNLILVGACQAGICPEKQTALYFVPVASILMLLFLLLIPPAETGSEAGEEAVS
ncbi:MAG TPA: hypothetical protein VHK69_21400 [Chitinophagaceae bacterium]|jgi:hypothetical protein|nr:hypothetical protein [Chitinophagaceae bacterium]